ncbi:MAG: phosphate uptake regulator PhoU [Zestosphaera sp.]
MPEIRRIQKFGKSTLMVSLPASWVKSMKLSPGDSVTIDLMEDGTLRVVPLYMAQKKEERVLQIKVSKSSSETLLARSIIAGYLLGVDVVIVEAMDGVLSETHLRTVRDVVKELLGAEILEHTPNKVSVQILVDPSKYSAINMLNRLVNRVKFMIQHLQIAVIDNKPYLLDEISEIEKEVDRLHALAVRQILQAQNDRTLVKHLGIKASLIPEYRGIVKGLEEAADALSITAQILKELESRNQLPLLTHESNILKESLDYLLMTVDRIDRTFKTLDLYIANEILNMVTEYYTLIRKYDELLFRALKEKEEPKKEFDKSYVMLREFIDRLIEVGRAMEAVSEAVFDISVERAGTTLDICKVYI